MRKDKIKNGFLGNYTKHQISELKRIYREVDEEKIALKLNNGYIDPILKNYATDKELRDIDKMSDKEFWAEYGDPITKDDPVFGEMLKIEKGKSKNPNKVYDDFE